ncbi:Galactoside Alpha-(1,2)-Fucosyltransferase 2 [Manis pentadactyla]|nr:Galactoside Alpha-(1,2)-Fucosyltransferase 2 [Manis pentadactyla]
MGEYAMLYALAKASGWPAFIPARMHSALAPVLHGPTASRIPRRNYHLNDGMEEHSRTFYRHLQDELLQEFTPRDHVWEEAQKFLWALQAKWAWQATCVGVHMR